MKHHTGIYVLKEKRLDLGAAFYIANEALKANAQFTKMMATNVPLVGPRKGARR